MKFVNISAVVALLIGLSTQNVDLGPAYSIHIPGTTQWKEIRRIEKDPVFVEGLEFIDENSTTFIESVGQYWGSKIRKVSISADKADSDEGIEHSLPPGIFGEGCTKFNDMIYQMTYREEKVYVYDANTLELIKELNMP
jgi:glutamine cyclotransferase